MFIYDDGIPLHIELTMPSGSSGKNFSVSASSDSRSSNSTAGFTPDTAGFTHNTADFTPNTADFTPNTADFTPNTADLTSDAAGCPLIILIHGFTGHMDERHILAMTEMMNRTGFAVLRAEMYGHGQSGGTFRDHTLFKWLTNAMFVIDYARSLPFVSSIYLGGHSQGGLTAMLAGAMKRDVLAGLIPLSPACCIPSDARRGSLLGTDFDPVNIPEIIGVYKGMELGGNYARAAQTIHLEDACRFEGPVLIVHGDSDESVDVRWAYEAANYYKDCTLEIIPGDTHCYDNHLDEAVEAVRRWLISRI